MATYYNEFDPFAAAWLRELIAAGHLPAGDVDERDMREVQADEIRHYTQHHFFAGIGGWAYALRLAGWPDDRPVLTGSPPCQPFSVAGRGEGVNDERHLAPHFLELVRALRPPVVFGEQVAAAVEKDEWLDELLDELEDQGYATGAVVLPACSVGFPHKRERLFFSANTASNGRKRLQSGASTQVPQDRTLEALGTWDSPSNPFANWKKLLASPGTCSLDDGIPSTVEVRPALRGYGNAIVPQVAVEVIREVM